MKLFKCVAEAPFFHGKDHNGEEYTEESRKAATRIWYEEFRARVDNIAGLQFPEQRPSFEWYGREFEFTCTDRVIGDVMVQLGYDVERRSILKDMVMIMDLGSVDSQLKQMCDRLELAAKRVGDMADGRVNGTGDDWQFAQGWNEKTNSPVPGTQLHQVNRILLKENCCSDELQNALNNGWRLLAVCPQEARRPDYVLGKYENGNGWNQAAREA